MLIDNVGSALLLGTMLDHNARHRRPGLSQVARESGNGRATWAGSPTAQAVTASAA